uniref:Uncharacterized protein n=1 Tax=Meloidogyne enterolobii TaxID=390850 RepID=A0A6V7WW22_MELEN|nr:unnamed protein product [Meloidogyne enterolobii]
MFSIGNKFVIVFILFVIICEFNVESVKWLRGKKVLPVQVGYDEHAENLAQVRNDLNGLNYSIQQYRESGPSRGVTADSLREEHARINNILQSNTQFRRELQESWNGIQSLMQYVH